jgi:muramoyltetrapeptide carboxypeptidase
MIKPNRLKPGHRIAVIAPAGPVKKARLNRGMKTLRKLGYQVSLSENIWLRKGYLAGDDPTRALSLKQMFTDPNIDAVICARGGFGSVRILEMLDYAAIRRNPKVFVGYSDITLLHLALNKFSNLVTFHGPMVATDFDDLTQYTREFFLKAVGSARPVGVVRNPKALGKWRIISPGRSSGLTLGGNLTSLTKLLGTRFEPDFRKRILFLEDLNEDIYRIDGMLAQLKLAGVLRQVKGVILGEFVRCQPSKKASFTLEETFQHYFSVAKYPVIYPVPCGHGITRNAEFSL